jgi:DNA-binding LacI/PurR family transcriptional regulator
MKRATLMDIAKKAGVSIASVSRVLREEENVSNQIVDRVQKAIQELKYDGGKPRTRNRRAVGLVVPDVTNPFFSIMLKGIESVARINNYNIIIHNSEDKIEYENDSLDRLVDFSVNGVILTPTAGRNEKIDNLLEEAFPIVLADRKLAKQRQVCTVSVDNEDGAYQAVKYLLKLGHRRILHLAGPQQASTERDRYSGYQKALLEASMEPRTKDVITGNYHFEDAYGIIKQTITRNSEYTAVFSSNDIMALGALQALKDMDLRVPEDISVFGYDGIPFSSLVQLTTVSQPAFEMGRNSMILLIDLIEGRIAPPHSIILKPSLVIRNTCRTVR